MSSMKFKEELVQKTKPYYLGLDIGTSTIGYAITDKEYNIIKKGRKALWGVHKYYEANTAAETRGFRSSRRNKNRRKQRLALLEEYFSEEICKVDPAFYQRMKDSFFTPDDKSEYQTYSLFNDPDFNDETYHELYPTIYHLRNELMKCSEPHDVRLVFLALHHIMKHRGHFLFENKTLNVEGQVSDQLNLLATYYFDTYNEELWLTDKIDEVKQVLEDSSKTSREKLTELNRLLVSKEASQKEINKLIIGNKTSLNKLFNDEELNESELNNLNISESKYEENIDGYRDLLGDRFELIDRVYGLYSAVVLEQLLTDEDNNTFDTLSSARIAIYNRHGEDLRQLKDIIKWYDSISKKNYYFGMFRENKKKHNNYVAYSGHVDSRSTSSPLNRCNQQDFLKYIDKILEEMTKDSNVSQYKEKLEEINRIRERISLDQFLPKITSSSNGVIPYQLHQHELKSILKNAQEYLPFLTDEVVSEIEQIFTFKLPYYVGPLNTASEEFSWVVRRSFKKIMPWNFEEVVDVIASAEKFISRMTNKCTYLIGEDVLPKESLLYSEFMVRNALNKLKVDETPLDKETREHLFNTLFVNNTRSGRITKTRIVSSLKNIGWNVTTERISGIDDIPVQLKARKDFNRILKGELSNKEIEQIILKITVLPDSTQLITNWLKETFGEKLSDEQIKKIAKLRYTGWGRLSEKFLTGLRHVMPDGIVYSVLEYMREYPVNFIEIINDKSLEFNQKIELHNENFLKDKFTIDDAYLEELYLSPPVKKAVRKVSLLIKELMGIMGGAPEKVFIEMTRKDGEKGRTKSRKQQINELYQNLKSVSKGFDESIRSYSDSAAKSWNNSKDSIEEDRLKSKKLYLYLRQWGRCMYSGDIININDLFDPSDSSKYDIDHIYPRSLTKDDSWNNLVLVKQDLNRLKGDQYPVMDTFQKKMHQFWYALNVSGFIPAEKYNRLTRTEPLTAKDLDGFINRQLVETSQTTKQIADILKRLLENSEVVYVKATHVSDFRYRDGTRDNAYTKFYFPKLRNINDYHHAKDAYLNIVVGNAYHFKFTKNFMKRYYNRPITNLEKDQKYNLEKFFDNKIFDGQTEIWTPGPKGTITTVEKMMNRNNVLLSYESRRQRGGFFDQQLVKKGSGQYPIKTSDKRLHNLDKYGGYNKLAGSHFCIVKFEDPKRKKKTIKIEIVSIPLIVNVDNQENLIKYLEENNYHNPEILYDNLLYGSMIEIDGVKYRIKGKSGSAQLTCELGFQGNYSADDEKLLKNLERCAIRNKYDLLDDFQINDLYINLVEKLSKPPFSSSSTLKDQSIKLKEKTHSFSELKIEDKVEIILSMTSLLNGSGNPVDLTKIYSTKNKTMGKSSGYIRISRNILNMSINIVNTSISGFFENEIKVL